MQTLRRDDIPPTAAACVEWAMFCNRLSLHLFRIFLRLVPKEARPRWTARALEKMERASFEGKVEFLVGVREVARLARVIDGARQEDLVAAGFEYLDPAARMLRKSYPASAARAQVAIAREFMRWGSYFLSLIPLRKARLLYRRTGSMAEWDAVVTELLAAHPRARRFQEGLKAVAAGKREDPDLADHCARRSLWARGARL